MSKGKVDVLLGLQWGDEGKGKVVDVLTPEYDVIARFQGGPNAGHTLEFNGEKYVLRSIPSGIFQGGKVNVIGNGVVLAPDLFMAEAQELERSGHDLKSRLYISRKAHLIMPTHRLLDAAYESAKGASKVGTTGKGIGPAYTDKVSRNGLRVGDIFDGFEEKYAQHKAQHEAILRSLNYTHYDLSQTEQAWMKGVNYLRVFNIVDSEHELNHLLQNGKSILCEGAQGTMLDVDFEAARVVLPAAHSHKGASVVECLVNCVIFNNGTHSAISSKEARAEHTIFLEHGKPMIFGADKDKGLVLDGLDLKVVKIGENGVKESDILVHDAKNPDYTLQLKLAKMRFPDMPVAMGVIRDVEEDHYDELLERQIADVQAKSRIKCFDDLIGTLEQWDM